MPDIKMPDGAIVSFPDDMPQEQIKGMIAQKFPEVAPQQEEKDVSRIRAFQKGVADTATLGFGDEMKAGLSTLGNELAQKTGFKPDVPIGDTYNYFLDKTRQETELAQEQRGGYYTGGQVGGAALQGLGAGAALAPTRVGQGIAYATSKGFLPAAATYSGLGALSGGTYALGSGEGGAQERFGEVPAGAGYGALGGMAGATVARTLEAPVKKIGSLTQKALNTYSKKAAKASQKALPEVLEGQTRLPEPKELPKAYSKVKKALAKDFGGDLDVVLQGYKNTDMSLSDFYGKRTSSLAESASLFPTGREIAEEAFEGGGGKITKSYDRLIDSVRKNISGIDNYYANADDLINAGRLKAAPIYKKAFDTNKEIASPRLDRILNTPEGKAALKTTAKNYANKMSLVAKPKPELTKLAKELESLDMMAETKGGVSGGLKLEVLDAIKKEMDSDLAPLYKQSVMDAAAKNKYNALNSVKKALVEEVDSLDSSGLYAKARATSGEYLQVNDAMDTGRDVLKGSKYDAEQAKRLVSGYTEQEKNAFKIGVGKALREELGQVNDGSNPYARILGNPNKYRKLKSVLSENEFFNFEKSLKAEKKLFELRNKVLSGSPTARREELKSLMANGAVDSISAVPVATFTSAISAAGRKISSGISDDVATKVSNILYETDPIKKLQIINNLGKSKTLTPQEIKLTKEIYSTVAPKFDALSIGAISGGTLASE